MEGTAKPVSLASLSERQRAQAMARFALLQPHLERNVPLARAARDGGVALRTARRWLQSFRAEGLFGLVRAARSDAGTTQAFGGFDRADRRVGVAQAAPLCRGASP